MDFGGILCCLLMLNIVCLTKPDHIKTKTDDIYHGIYLDENNASQLIIHGDVAFYGQHPYMVSIQLLKEGNWEHSCGGTIISPRTILTAAHCVAWNHTGVPFRVVAGVHRLHESDDFEVYRDVGQFIVYPEFQRHSPGIPGDLAILHMTSALTFNSHVSSLALAAPGDDFTHHKCNLVGWGRTSANGERSNVLLSMDTTVLSNSDCNQHYEDGREPSEVILPTHVCSLQPPAGPCDNDSGAPLQCSGVLVGVLSWGRTGCNVNFPAVFTRVSQYRQWIAHYTV
ncbi:chymotrypsin-1-like [Littorina saxatilis]|uniref:Peptidase S1 domain-containing protein n=1 Tax=Littorina saxatilis TaxID=31220 RepID=A0AAN9AR44_9CAEN